ncbi:MAG TPA: translation elongation factor Ts [Acidimicrobiales bacterium]|jgi:elongation factor Ts|nr:translation elongation factor Ts [Acidimicrobiales bacterium]
MAEISAKEVKALRDATGAGILDAKKALVETNGDQQAAAQLLREKGLVKAGQRSDREAAQGAVAAAFVAETGVAALVQLKSETDFVAKSPPFIQLAAELAKAVAEEGEAAVDRRKDAIDDLQVTLRENIQLGRVVRFEAAPGNVLETYLHVQSGRGVNGVLVEISGGSDELAHDVAVHIAFGKPGYVRREDVPPEEVAAERATLEAQTRNEGKPEQAIPKIVDTKLAGWYKRVPGGVLLEQPYAKDEKQTVAQILGSATVVRFAQVLIGE